MNHIEIISIKYFVCVCSGMGAVPSRCDGGTEGAGPDHSGSGQQQDRQPIIEKEDSRRHNCGETVDCPTCQGTGRIPRGNHDDVSQHQICYNRDIFHMKPCVLQVRRRSWWPWSPATTRGWNPDTREEYKSHRIRLQRDSDGRIWRKAPVLMLKPLQKWLKPTQLVAKRSLIVRKWELQMLTKLASCR